jgi:hypothetical protein
LADQKLLGFLEKKIYSNKYRPKDVKCLMAKIRKELMSIETTAKAQKAYKLGVTLFCK